MPRNRGGAIGDLLDWQPPVVKVQFDGEVIKAASLGARISKAVAAALKQSGQSRDAVAQLMSDRLGERVTAAMLDAYASEAKEGHRITLERFMALVEVTKQHELLGFVAAPFGYAVVPEHFGDVIDLHLLEQKEAEIAIQIRALRAKRGGK